MLFKIIILLLTQNMTFKVIYFYHLITINSCLTAPLEWIRNQIAINANPRDILNKLVPELTIVSAFY